MTRVPPFDRRATEDDFASLPDHLVGEIVDGELHASPPPAPLAAASAVVLGATLRRGTAQAGPGWQILPGPELRLGGDILVPALAGWRLSRLPQLPATTYFPVAPDWVCDIVSSGAASSRARRMARYASEGVSHAWLLDPVARALEVRRLEGGRWRDVATYAGSQLVRAEPFEAVELALGSLWPGEVAETRPRRVSRR